MTFYKRRINELGRMVTLRYVHLPRHGIFPFELIYDHQATISTVLSQPPKPTYAYDDYVQELRERLRAISGKKERKTSQNLDQETI